MEDPATYRAQLDFLRKRLTAERQFQTFFVLEAETGKPRFVAPIVASESMNGPAAPPLVTPEGKVIVKYQALRQSLPGLVSFIPARVRSEAALRGVGEGTLVHFDEAARLPSWLLGSRYTFPVTVTNDVIVSITRRLMHELEAGTPGRSYLKSLGNALLAELEHELARPNASLEPIASRSGIRVAHTAVRHMLANLGEPLSVADLARICGVGMTSFANSFRQATGSTPHRFLRKARIERACELLRTTGLSVGDIAAVVGFRGHSHFCTAFLAERGLTPTRYRKAARRTVGRGHSLPKSSNICTRKRTPVAHRVATPKPINMENK